MRHPRTATRWAGEFLDDKIVTPRHRRHSEYYDHRAMQLVDALSVVLNVAGPDVEAELAKLPDFLTSERPANNPTDKWVATNELAAIDYVAVKLLRPEIVVETGVWSGTSSWSILHAMDEIAHGRLISIDLPTPNTNVLPEVGHLVPKYLRYRWELRIGAARTLLPSVIQEVGQIDIFQHDSRHSYSNQTFEFSTAWPAISPQGLLVSDDVSNDALHDACESWNQSPVIVHQSKSSPVGLVRK